MALRFGLIGIAALLAGVGAVAPAQALTMKECSAKYKAAELGWNAERFEMERFPKGAVRSRRQRSSRPGESGNAPVHSPGRARERSVPNRDLPEVLKRGGRQGSNAHLRRSIQRQQGGKPKRWPEVDRKGRGLLQRVQQASQGLSALQRSGEWQKRIRLSEAADAVKTVAGAALGAAAVAATGVIVTKVAGAIRKSGEQLEDAPQRFSDLQPIQCPSHFCRGGNNARPPRENQGRRRKPSPPRRPQKNVERSDRALWRWALVTCANIYATPQPAIERVKNYFAQQPR